jgi:hypothetical protein
MLLVGFADVNAHRGSFAFGFLMGHDTPQFLETIRSVDAGHRKKQAQHHAAGNVGAGAKPLASILAVSQPKLESVV